MADCDVEVVEEQQLVNRKGKGKKERNWKDEEMEHSLPCMRTGPFYGMWRMKNT